MYSKSQRILELEKKVGLSKSGIFFPFFRNNFQKERISSVISEKYISVLLLSAESQEKKHENYVFFYEVKVHHEELQDIQTQ